jgi:hypothetical protein
MTDLHRGPISLFHLESSACSFWNQARSEAIRGQTQDWHNWSTHSLIQGAFCLLR